MIVGLDHLDIHRRYVAVARYDVIIEIRLLHCPVLDADALGERQPDAVDDAALGLRHHIIRLHRRAAVDGTPDVVNLDLASGPVDRDFHYRCHLRAGVVDVGGAKTMAFALPAPTGHL